MINNKGITLIEIYSIIIFMAVIMSFFAQININKERYNIQQLLYNLQKYNTAIKSFHIKYGDLPGDLRKTQILGLSVNNTDGNENNLIDDKNQQNNILDKNLKADGEIINFWLHLYNSKILNGNIKVLPYVDFLKTSIIIFSNENKNYYHLSIKGIDNKKEIQTINNFTPNQAYLIDKKLDDGLPFSGKILASGGNKINKKLLQNVDRKCAVNNEYLTANKENLCQLIYELNID